MQVATCSTQTVNQNTNVPAEVCKVPIKRTSGLTVTGLNFIIIVKFNLQFNTGISHVIGGYREYDPSYSTAMLLLKMKVSFCGI